jgi:hypothetical protein
MQTLITGFKTVKDVTSPIDVTVGNILSKIKSPTEVVKQSIIRLRLANSKEAKDEIKSSLPIVCFGGTFKKRSIDGLVFGSGLLVIDLDGLENAEKARDEMYSDRHVVAAFISPSGNGVKYLVSIPIVNGDNEYKDYFFGWHNYAYEKYGYDIDMSGQDISRACYLSYDKDIRHSDDYDIFKDAITDHDGYKQQIEPHSELDKYTALKKWAHKNDTYSDGNRNNFLYKLASACNRMGIDSMTCESNLSIDYDLDVREIAALVKSAYRRSDLFNTEKLKGVKDAPPKTQEEELKDEEFLKRVIHRDITNTILRDFYTGKAEYLRGKSTGIKFLDNLLLFKTNEFYQIIGHASIGKTFITLYLMLLAAKFADWKIILATSENAAEETKNILIAFLIGAAPDKNYHYKKDEIDRAIKFIDSHFMFLDTTGASIYDMMNTTKAIMANGVRVSALMLDPLNSFRFEQSTSAMSDYSKHQQQAADLLSFSIKECSVFLTTHTVTSKQRDAVIPSISDAEYGSVYANKAHVVMSYHRNPYLSGIDKDKTEIRIYKQRSKFMRGGDVTDKESPICFYYQDGFTFNVKYENVLYGYFKELNNPILNGG